MIMTDKLKDFIAYAGIFCCMIALFAGCCETDSTTAKPDEPPTEDRADVTIIFLGTGGGSLDGSIFQDIRDFFRAKRESYQHVKVAVQYKFSKTKKWRSEEEETDFWQRVAQNGEQYMDTTVTCREMMNWIGVKQDYTYRFILDADKPLHQLATEGLYSTENMDITHPDSLANYIRWAAEKCPARQYVLMLSDHGRGYLPNEEVGDGLYEDYYKIQAEARTRALMDDKGNYRHLTAKTLADAIRKSGIHLNTIYYDCCLMNSLEYHFEMRSLCDYIIASSYVVQNGGDYKAVIDCMAENSLDNGQAQKALASALMEHWNQENWDGKTPYYADVTVTRTDKLEQLGEQMRLFVDKLCTVYEQGTDDQRRRIDAVTAKAVRVSDKFSRFDAAKYMAQIISALPEVFDAQNRKAMEKTFNDCIAAQYYSRYLQLNAFMVDYTVLLCTEGSYFRTTWTQKSDADSKYIERATRYMADGKVEEYNGNSGYYNNENDYDYALVKTGEDNWGGTLATTFGQLDFDKITNWSRWLLLNRQSLPLYSKSGFNEEVNDDDD